MELFMIMWLAYHLQQIRFSNTEQNPKEQWVKKIHIYFPSPQLLFRGKLARTGNAAHSYQGLRIYFKLHILPVELLFSRSPWGCKVATAALDISSTMQTTGKRKGPEQRTSLPAESEVPWEPHPQGLLPSGTSGCKKLGRAVYYLDMVLAK